MVYQIRVKGHLGRERTEWFAALSVELEKNGDTVLTVEMADQAALHGLLRKVRDLGIPLISINRVEGDQSDAPRVKLSKSAKSSGKRKGNM